MESEARYTIVGAGLLLITGLLVIAVLWLSGRGYEGQRLFFTIYFRDASLAGLQPNSDVTMRGIKVGKVVHYAFSPTDIEAVKVTVQVNADTPVREDTRAVIQRNFVTGIARINLVETTAKSKALATVADGELYPVIAEGDSKFGEIENTLPEIARRTHEVLARVSSVLSPENQQALAATLENITDLTANLKKREASLGKTLENFDGAIAQIKVLAESLTAATQHTNRRIDEVSRELVGTLQQVKVSIRDIGRNSEDVTASLKEIADATMLELQGLARELKTSAERFSAIMQQYSAPKEILFGPSARELGPGESLP